MEVVKKEAKRILAGIMVLDILLLIVAISFGFFTKNMAYSMIYSSIYCYINFVVSGYFMDRIIRKEATIAQKQMLILFIIKYFIMFISMGIGVLSGFFDVLGLFVPLLAPKFTYFIIAIFKKEV